ncbi:MAG: carboxypeptidase regulatory-like domain-containing protein [Acidobacteriota bacterium]|nr:carboxypeptidase regulatory-like domain-containing protein [Acidobacteriota bacterium]
MQRFRFMLMAIALGMLLPALVAQGQANSGNLYGKVVDEQQGALPGVSVSLSGQGAPQTTFTDPRGEFHFLNLSPGPYDVTTSLQGFTTVERKSVIVNLGQNTNLTIPMKISSVSATVTVTGETPVLDTRRESTGSVFNQMELQSIPTGRDPWVIIQQTPGVQIDRLNVGGTQSGQQSSYIGMGTDATQNSYNMDGVNITDMSALGSSPTYYDFDQFQEIQVATGGVDPAVSVPGVTLNMVTKRGTNDVHGSARYFYTPGELQANNAPAEAKRQADLGLIGPGITSANINKNVDRVCTINCKGASAGVQDYGVEAGGPLWKDKAWLWGSYGRKEIPVTKLGGASDTTYLDDYAGKLNIQPLPSTSGTVFYFRGGKSKFGRSAGVTRPAETSVDQTGPTPIWRGQLSQVFGPSLVADVSYDYNHNGFSLTPESGPIDPASNVYLDPGQVYHRSFIFNVFDRPQHQVNANVSAFFNTGSLGHEIKAGFGWRNAPITSVSFWPGNGSWGDETPATGPFIANLTRPAIVNQQYVYYSGFVGDTLTASNLTINVGARYDYQYGNNQASSVTANPLAPDLVPGVSYPGSDPVFHWKDLQPRVGVTYALGAEKRTLLRASYSRYADQLGGSIVPWDNPVGGSGISGAQYEWNDVNHDNTIQRSEIGRFLNGIGGFDPANPTSLTSTQVIDPHLRAPLTDEFQVSFEHQLLADLGLGMTGTYRHRTRVLYSPFIGVSAANYRGTTLSPQGYDVFGNPVGSRQLVYGTDPLPDDFTGGEFVSNRPDYAQNYYGVQLQATKRLSSHWMMHGSVNYSDWKQKISNKDTACVDPTNQRLAQELVFGFPGPNVGPSCSNGELYQQSVGSGNFGSVWINSHWGFNVSGLYQLPLNFNVAANFYGRQGYVNPLYVRVNTGNGEGRRSVLVGNPEDFRLRNVYELDLRIEKVVALFAKADLTLGIDVFNALNANTILQRQSNATAKTTGCPTGVSVCGNAGQILEIQNPRAVRAGARISF